MDSFTQTFLHALSTLREVEKHFFVSFLNIQLLCLIVKVATHSICFVGYDLPVLKLFKKLVCHAWEQKGEDLSWVACHLSSTILTSTLA